MDASPTKAWLIAHRNDPKWKWHYDFAFGKRPAEELYDLAKDPDQINNVAADPAYAKAKQELAERLHEAARPTPATRASPATARPSTAPRSPTPAKTRRPRRRRRKRRSETPERNQSPTSRLAGDECDSLRHELPDRPRAVAEDGL